jgi:hypothetical protein
VADNVVLPGTGSSVATDEIGGNQFQRMKLTLGADGVNDGDVSSTNPIPVTGGLTDAELRATAVPVAVNDVTGELIEAIEALRMTVGSLSRTIGLSIPDLLGRLRVSVDVISGGLTLSTVSTLSNQTQIGGFVAADQIPALMHMSADNLRRNITVT